MATAPLAPRDRRLEVDERVAADGAVLRAPDEAELEAIAGRLRAMGVEALAVCGINS